MLTRSLKLAASASAFAAVLTLAAGVPAAQAQAPMSRVNVPFAFEVGSAHFAPGVYTIRRANNATLSISGTNNTALLMIMPEIGGNNAPGKAVFQRVGDKYFLTQVWNLGESVHFVSVKTNEFKKAQRIEEAALRATPQTGPAAATETTLALLR